jgi:hypothetical protein
MEVEVVAETGSKNLATRLPTAKKIGKIGKKKENNTTRRITHSKLKVTTTTTISHLLISPQAE